MPRKRRAGQGSPVPLQPALHGNGRIGLPHPNEMTPEPQRSERSSMGWYKDSLQPRLTGLRTIDVARALDISRVYARGIVRGEKIPHPRHFAALAKLAGVPFPQSA